MGFATKVQLIKRKASAQWYINFPSAIAQGMEFERGEVVEWVIEDKTQLVLRRTQPPRSALKKKHPRVCWSVSSGSLPKVKGRSAKNGSGGAP